MSILGLVLALSLTASAGFWMDETVVTNEQFAKFVAATGYVTIAERTPTKEEFPDAPEANLVAGRGRFCAD